MNKRVALALVLASSPAVALAQPGADTADAPTTPATSTNVAVATPVATPVEVTTAPNLAGQVAPWILRKGNLRVSIACAMDWAAPDNGLQLSVDGAPTDSQRVNGRWGAWTDGDGNSGESWNPSDVGYLLAPGHHHVQIDAPGCAPAAFDVDALPDRSALAEGRLAVTDSALAGNVGAPNGLTWGFGMMMLAAPVGASSVSNVSPQSVTWDGGHGAVGGYLSMGHERRNFAWAIDYGFAVGGVSGTTTGSDLFSNQPTSSSFTGNVYVQDMRLRLGARLPLQSVALEAGSGLGLQVWNYSTTMTDPNTTLMPVGGLDASFYLPMWASVTYKPSCDWGLQAMAQYDVHPASTDTDGFTFAGGLVYQPSNACSEPAGVRVSEN